VKYRKRILLSFAAVLVVPIVLNDLFIFYSIRQREITQKLEYSRAQVEQIRRSVGYIIDKIQADFVFFSYKEEIRYLKTWYETSDYREKRRFFDEFDSFSLVSDLYDAAYLIHPDDNIMFDLKNKLISSVDRSRAKDRIKNVIAMHDQFGGKRELFSVPGEEGGQLAYLVRSIPIPERGTRMILYVELSENLFAGALDDIFMVQDAYVLITDRDGAPMSFRSRAPKLAAADPRLFVPPASAAVSGDVVANEYGRFLIASAISPELGWIYHYGIDFSAINAAILAVLARFSAFTIGLLLAFALVVRRLSRGMYQPIDAMAALLGEERLGRSSDEVKDIQLGLQALMNRNVELANAAGDNTRYARETFLRSLILDLPRDRLDYRERAAALDLRLPHHPADRYVVCVGVARLEDAQTQVYADAFWGNRDSPFLKRFNFPAKAEVELFMADDRRFVFIVGGAQLGQADFRQIDYRGNGVDGSSVYLGVSAPQNDLRDVREAYREALVALEYRSVQGGRRTVFYEDTVGLKRPVYFYPIEAERRIVTCLKQLDVEGVDEQFAVVADLLAKAGVSVADAKRLYSHLADSLLLLAKDFDLPLDALLDPDAPDLGQALDDAEDAAGAAEIAYRLGAKMIERLRSTKESPMVALANAVKSFIDRRYADRNLSLELIADELKYSVSHVSAVFKDTFGETVKDYITGLRLSKARDLLMKTDLHIMRIGEQVGYDNLGSFVKIFKAYLGETPKGYRLRVRGK
jgi:AraC-like DNA-binding protein